ncbi:MAG: DUF1016 N-terminal domain-containing protein [Chromatiales bacterium]|nr:DUF1016 N-terminal domain-containing protein [Chromatiales bacterium]
MAMAKKTDLRIVSPLATQSAAPTRIPADYADWLSNIKNRVAAARQRAALAANAELVQLYWQIGHELLQRQQAAQWGDKMLDRLASDLREAFPEMKGFSARNLKYMRYFAEHCSSPGIWAAACCPITLVPHRDPADQAAHHRSPCMVCAAGYCRRLVTCHTGSSDPQPPD